MASPKKIIVVIGATGNQGGSVARTFLSLPNWNVRCITRNPSSESAIALVKLGAEVFKADLSQPATLPAAFAAANAIFLNTDFWETYRPLVASGTDPATCSQTAYKQEVENGKNAVNAAAMIPSLERLVYSSLPSMTSYGRGEHTRSLHPESKASIVKYIETEKSELNKKLSIIYAGAYNTNRLLSPALDPSSKKYVCISPLAPQAKMAIMDPLTSTGKFVRSLIEDEEPGVRLLAYDNESYLSMDEIPKVWSRVTGKEAHYIRMNADIMHQQLGLPYELLDALEATPDTGYDALQDVMKPKNLKSPPETQSFEAWLQARGLEDLLGEVPNA